ncbi:MAG: polymer-forming cytoskeletal protein, partial [Candidatus Yanofskybacteria bacterium]|nr:polymer-forming cytoskeletal protein [Candidatus Yanofskybacteria bacterium]
MKKLFILMAIAAVAVWPLGASAATFKTGESYSLGQNQSVNDDLYVGSGSVTISGVVTGDLIAAGGNLSFSGRVSEDATLAGGTVNINGTIGDDLRVAGGNVTLNGAVADDVFVAGGQVHVAQDAVINGDVVAAGGEVTIDGRVNGNINITSGQVKLGSSAVINGNLVYKSGKEAQIDSGARIAGTTQFNKISHGVPGRNFIGPFIVFSMVAKTIILLVCALLLIWIFRTKAPRVVHHALGNFWHNVLRGFLVMIAVPVAIIILFITVVGIPFAVLLL